MSKTIPSIEVPFVKKGVTSIINIFDELKNKKTIIFGVPGAFTPTIP